GALSGGQRQRVAIGRALVRDVDVFLFDEPLSNLDAKLRSELRVEIKRLHQKLANTMIYVTHDQIEALTLADRIAVMKGGLIQQLDEPLTIYNKPRNLFVASFIGSPSMNFLKGEIAEKDGKPVFRIADLDISLENYVAQESLQVGRSVIFGLRPEHIALSDQPGPAGRSCKATVDLDEPMGADSLVWLKVAGKAVSVRVDSGRRYQNGETVHLTFDPALASLFDSQTEDRI
ncbi:MAG: TOBE domain-containing protein, partial [Phyllobacterium sp.]|nr:TOBE domain-containing protein [Phyllobacterium sp.]